MFSFIFAGLFSASIYNETNQKGRLGALYDTNVITSGDPVEIEGSLTREPEQAPGGFYLFLSAENVWYKNVQMTAAGTVRLFLPVENEFQAKTFELLDIRYGSQIRAALNLKREDNFLNPGGRKQTEMLSNQSIEAVGSIKSPLLIEKIGDPHFSFPFSQIYRLRQDLISRFRSSFRAETAGIVIAALFGNRHFLDKRTAEFFREGGTFHVLVISGLHITFIGGILLLVVRLFTRNRLLQFLITGILLWSYALAVGAEIPVMRAALMFSMLLFSGLIFRRGNLPNSLALSVLILLIWRPLDLFSASFLLTVLSVASIVGIAFPLIEKMRAVGGWMPSTETPFPPYVPSWLKRFCEMLYWNEEVWRIESKRQIWKANLFKSPYLQGKLRRSFRRSAVWIVEGILVSLIVQIGLLPLLIVNFHRLSIFGFLLNLWVGALMAIESLAALIAVAAGAVSANLSFPFVKLTEFLNFTMIAAPQILVDLDIASIRIPVYSGNFALIYFVYFAPLLLLTFFVNRWDPFAVRDAERRLMRKFRIWQISAGTLALLAVLMILHPFSDPRPDGRLHVEFLDVGQGDSIFITFPNGETMLVDAGGRMNFSYENTDDGAPPEFVPDTASIGEFVVSEFLWERGYSKIDTIVATHADADHMQGLIDVAKNFSIKRAWFGRLNNEDELTGKLRSMLERRKIPVEIVSRGDNFEIGGARVEVLHPPPVDHFPVSQNDNSVVIKIKFGNRSFLLTGDIEKSAEKFLSGSADLTSDVVKAAHHGSKTSSIAEFIDRTKARFVVFPVGRSSPFGHPNKEVVERWRAANAIPLITGERGTISFSTDGVDLYSKTYEK